ncbi:adenosine deaminase [Gemmatirosa kalamazoonensis]|uniref:adenosine deaminase n=1 Tax=Gemmatirosa kalamazoonensis TaxID=861299 RepID=W0RPG2_9BACT|nr:adenosine deaminase [Gemmatirosa kalamazoonensis]AHG91373.1 adenosine deaminase [Gemmatirosa kalamazoonensis]
MTERDDGGARPPISRELLVRLPKAELHCHLDGSVRPETLLDLGEELGVPMPRATADELRDYMRVDDARHLEDYLERFEITLSVMQTEPAIERIAYELAADAAAEGVRYLEARFAPVLNTRRGLDLGAPVDAVLRGFARAEREHDVVARVIVCALRNQPLDLAVAQARLALDYRKHGVVGFDLAGGEAGNPARRFKEAFQIVRDNDMACTCHAGEGFGPESVRDAVHVCGCDRVGHGTRIIEDASLFDYINDRRICVECCLTSNVQTRATSSYETHPFREYFDRGLNVVLNTDNRLMSGTTLVDEYEHAVRRLGFTLDELAVVALNGFQSSFLPYPERRALIHRVESEIAALTGHGAGESPVTAESALLEGPQ